MIHAERLGGAGQGFPPLTTGAVRLLAHIVEEARAWVSIVFWPWLVYFEAAPSTRTSEEKDTTP